ncbi:MAG: hypothetical protein WAV41_00480 [Microgenomates group bacterium]
MINIETLRQFRIGNYAVFDLIVSFIGIYLLSPALSWLFRKINIDIPKINWLFLTLPTSIIVHLLIGNKTQMTKDFLDPSNHYLIKIIIIGFLLWGIRGIKIIK